MVMPPLQTSSAAVEVPQPAATIWARAAAAALAEAGRPVADGADAAAVTDALSVVTSEGLRVPALGVRRPDLPVPVARVSAGPGWDNRALVGDPATPDLVAAELLGGASSLWFSAPGSTEMATALADVDLGAVPVTTDHRWADLESVFTNAETVHPRSNLGHDLVGAAVRSAAPTTDVHFGAVVEAAQRIGVLGLLVDGTVAADRGAGQAAELSYLLASGTHLLRTGERMGISAAQLAGLIEFRVTVTGAFFLSLTKLRAFRWGWQRICTLSRAAAIPVRLHAVTARSDLWPADPHTNLLRGTTAAVAAVVGGADAITVLPFDLTTDFPDGSGRRLARNVSHLLAGESLLGRDDDPVSGAFALEELTVRTARLAWSGFADIERTGGIDAVLTDGSLLESWQQSAAVRSRQIDVGTEVIVGVNAFQAARS